MATLSTALDFARTQGQTDSNGLNNTNGIIFANEALLDYRRKMIANGLDAAQIQESHCDGIVPAVNGNGSTFLYPTNMFFLKSIEVNFADNQPGNYITAQQVDNANIPGGQSFSWLRKNQPANSPLFDDHGDWYEIFPAFTSGNNISQAIRMFYYLEPTEFTSVSDTISYPESLDYRILGWRIAANYYYSLNKFQEGDAFNARYEAKVKDIIGTLGRGSQQPIQAVPIQDAGWQY